MERTKISNSKLKRESENELNVQSVQAGRSVRSAVTRFPTKKGRQWLAFDNPVDTITVYELSQVRDALEQVSEASKTGLWAVGFVAYDAGPAFDPAIHSHRDPSVPLAAFGLFEHPTPTQGPVGANYELTTWTSSQTKSEFEKTVQAIKIPIQAGETYQVNHTIRLQAEFTGDPLGLFERMERAQKSDYSAYINLGNAAVCSASPELFFRKDGDRITTRPMKGTRPRHPEKPKDQQLLQELAASPKDQAENTMIVDMMRNDIGRIATIGTLQVSDLHTVETYPTVHQMTSTVSATTAASLVEIFHALFPGASITGAPKFSTSKLITTFEPTPRGIYTGAVGVISPEGTIEFNIAIRTAWVDQCTNQVEYGVGCGIVWGSDPTEEWLEAQDKSKVLKRCQPSLQLLETMKWEPQQGVHRLERHLTRLQSTAKHFAFDLHIDEIRQQLSGFQHPTSARLRLLVSCNGSTTLQVLPLPETASSTDLLPPRPNIDTKEKHPTVGFDTTPIDPTNEFLYHKTTERSRYQQALANAHTNGSTHPDVLLWNAQGEITESTIGNLVIEVALSTKLGVSYVTPPVSCGLLAGTLRAELLDKGVISEQVVTFTDLKKAKRVFIINAVRNWVEVSIDWAAAPSLFDEDK